MNAAKNHEHLEENRKFQLERVSLFSDAVIAIAITLLIIEIKLPEDIDHGTASKFLDGLLEIQGRFYGFLCSFILIGLYWTIHHKIFEFVKSFDNKLLWLNIFFLLAIVILPFSTSLAFENFTVPDYPWIIYSLNHIFVGISLIRMWSYLKNNPEKTVGLQNDRFIEYKKWRSLGTVLVFAFSILFGFLFPIAARFSPILILLSIFLVKRRFKDVIEK